MLMKRRSFPSSSLICVASAGKVWSMSARRPGRFSAAESNCLRPSVWRVKAAGSTTLMGMNVSCGGQLGFGNAVQLSQVGVEVGQPRANSAFFRVTAGECVGCLEAVAGDAGDGEFIGRDAAVGVEARGNGSGDAAGGFGEDAFGLGKLLHAGDDLDIGDIFRPAAGITDHLGGGGT